MNSARVLCFILMTGWLSVSDSMAVGQPQNNLVGEVSVEQILDHNRIFRIYTERYEPDEEALQFLKRVEGDISLRVFFGSWCRESTKYLPGLVKTLNVVNNNEIKATYMGVDAQKKFPDRFLKLFDIKYIPTVVVLKNGIEVGRIVEKPQQPIETELVQILKRLQEN
ncbi:thioredoxin family protein [Gracilimonas amylolytica]|uniref:thioredoxin family protein n=1 Tax=Gracilimonas amylolytica TaxID=1749045 RepID=UPI001300072B|nr:thioredoxin family protein [Gracilimonas amylolytica]